MSLPSHTGLGPRAGGGRRQSSCPSQRGWVWLWGRSLAVDWMGAPMQGSGPPSQRPIIPLPSVPRRPFPPSPPSTGTFGSGYYFVSPSIISCLVNLYSINK